MVTRRRPDDGSVLILTLIFTAVLSVVVLALAEYATVGLRTSRVATVRTETTADASGAVHWAIEQFAKKTLTPDDHCGEAPTYELITLPSGLLTAGVTVVLKCRETTPMTGEPVIHLIAETHSGPSKRTVEAMVEVPSYLHGARVADWRVDIPIAVPPLVTTTTTAATAPTTPSTAPDDDSTTTTTTTLAPQPTCSFGVTAAAANGKSGSGVLSISNVDGGAFSGWTVRILQDATTEPWQFTWDASVAATVSDAHVTVANGPSNAEVAAGAVDQFNVTAGLVVDEAQAITSGAQLTCTFLDPAP